MARGDNEDIDTTGESFLRGVQPTDASGVATFTTIYPGWYRGRTTHFHIKVHFNDNTRVTTQLFLPDDITAEVYGQQAYSERGQKDTSNDDDGFSASATALRMTVESAGDGHVARHTLGIERT